MVLIVGGEDFARVTSSSAELCCVTLIHYWFPCIQPYSDVSIGPTHASLQGCIEYPLKVWGYHSVVCVVELLKFPQGLSLLCLQTSDSIPSMPIFIPQFPQSKPFQEPYLDDLGKPGRSVIFRWLPLIADTCPGLFASAWRTFPSRYGANQWLPEQQQRQPQPDRLEWLSLTFLPSVP